MPKWLKEIIPYIIIIVAVIIIRTFIVTPIIVDGSSMEKTLHDNNVLLLKKFGQPKRFDVIVFYLGSERLIKRVIALPGEEIKILDGSIYVNGKLIEENYGIGTTSDFPKEKLASNEYFVLGDNRENSKDSRSIGPVKEKDIKGITGFRIWPINQFGSIN